MHRALVLLLLLAAPGSAETVVATRTIRPQQIVTAQDVRVDPATVPGAHSDLGEVIGKEARVAIYPARAVMRGTLAAPALVDRNQVVELVFSQDGLHIVTEGRALGRGGVGERIRVMNLSSRAVLFGTIAPDGRIEVTP